VPDGDRLHHPTHGIPCGGACAAVSHPATHTTTCFLHPTTPHTLPAPHPTHTTHCAWLKYLAENGLTFEDLPPYLHPVVLPTLPLRTPHARCTCHTAPPPSHYRWLPTHHTALPRTHTHLRALPHRTRHYTFTHHTTRTSGSAVLFTGYLLPVLRAYALPLRTCHTYYAVCHLIHYLSHGRYHYLRVGRVTLRTPPALPPAGWCDQVHPALPTCPPPLLCHTTHTGTDGAVGGYTLPTAHCHAAIARWPPAPPRRQRTHTTWFGCCGWIACGRMDVYLRTRYHCHTRFHPATHTPAPTCLHTHRARTALPTTGMRRYWFAHDARTHALTHRNVLYASCTHTYTHYTTAAHCSHAPPLHLHAYRPSRRHTARTHATHTLHARGTRSPHHYLAPHIVFDLGPHACAAAPLPARTLPSFCLPLLRLGRYFTFSHASTFLATRTHATRHLPLCLVGGARLTYTTPHTFCPPHPPPHTPLPHAAYHRCLPYNLSQTVFSRQRAGGGADKQRQSQCRIPHLPTPSFCPPLPHSDDSPTAPTTRQYGRVVLPR